MNALILIVQWKGARKSLAPLPLDSHECRMDGNKIKTWNGLSMCVYGRRTNYILPRVSILGVATILISPLNCSFTHSLWSRMLVAVEDFTIWLKCLLGRWFRTRDVLPIHSFILCDSARH